MTMLSLSYIVSWLRTWIQNWRSSTAAANLTTRPNACFLEAQGTQRGAREMTRRNHGKMLSPAQGNRVVLRYFSPLSGRMVTMTPDSICLAISTAAYIAAPLLMPTKIPSCLTIWRVIS